MNKTTPSTRTEMIGFRAKKIMVSRLDTLCAQLAQPRSVIARLALHQFITALDSDPDRVAHLQSELI